MQLTDVFLTPLGLVALASVVPLVVLYLLRPKPAVLELPTFEFLGESEETGTRNRFIDRLQRDALLLLQLFVLVCLALALATPYLSVPSAAVAEETVLVVDASASMATVGGGAGGGAAVGGETRFARAVSAAADDASGSTDVVVAEGATRVALRDGSAAAARQTLGTLRVTDAPGDVGDAVTTAVGLASSDDARIVVYSDFAGDDWRESVERARADGRDVELRQFDGGGEDNVGVVDLSFADERATVAVRNSGETEATREVNFAGQRESVTLAPGDTAFVAFDVPPGEHTVSLSPGDSFATDDTASVAAPATEQIRVLLITNDENRYLTTALGLVDEVDLTVVEPPAAVTREYDVVIFSDVEPQRLLQGDLEMAGDTLDRGGGVGVLAQPEIARMGYGDLLPVRPTDELDETSETAAVDDPLTRDIDFAGGTYVVANPGESRTLVFAPDGSPIVATAQRGSGRTLYYGYVEDESAFRYNYLYPVFWKRAVFELAGRASLEELNRATGERLQFGTETTVSTPSGQQTGTSVALDDAGFYGVGGREVGVSLLDADESNVSAAPVTEDVVAGGTAGQAATARVPLDLTPAVVAVVLVAVAGELLYLRRRGDV